MIQDTLKNLDQYGLSKEVVSLVQTFAERAVTESLEVGRYELKGNDIFALIQSYETKEHDNAKLESHEIYTDIQYILEGIEAMDYTTVEGLMVKEDKRPEKDVIFYHKRDLMSELIVGQGDFALFLPADAHAPNKLIGTSKPMKKIVFKIKTDCL